MRSMLSKSALTALALLLAACAVQEPPSPSDRSVTPREASNRPVAPAGPPLPTNDAGLTSIAFGSCNSGDRPIPILESIAAESHDLFLYIGDNVYGDARSGDPQLPELRAAYRELAERPEFRTLRRAVPMLATWDDHDYGLNDAGRGFAFKDVAEDLFLDFWRVPEDDVRRRREGIYAEQLFGPEGRRIQILLLDTRYFRSDLTPTDERGAVGRERYLPSADPDQTMLGDAQWAWLEDALQTPADLRLLVSSIQVHADGHGWEAWRMMPLERDRLYRLIESTGAEGVVLVSGDRHSAGLYVREGLVPYPLYEITSSSLNRSVRDVNNEPGPHRIGDMYAPVNYGVIGVDWDAGELALQIKDLAGDVVREQIVDLAELRRPSSAE